MPLVGADYQQRTREDILGFLQASLRQEFGANIDLSESSVFLTLADALAGLDSTELEPALEEVYNSSFVDTASGENLDKLVALLGVLRREATRATGTIRFSHGQTVKQNYTINNGTIVQTSGSDPVEFETTELVSLFLFDDFESGSLDVDYLGDTASFTVNSTQPIEGSFSLEAAATADVRVFKDAIRTYVGSTFDYRNYLPTGSIVGNLFGVLDSNDYYRVKLDEVNGTHSVEKVVNGTPTTLVSTSLTIPAAENLRNEVEWIPKQNGTIISRLYDSTDTLVDEIEVNGENTIVEGGYGFESLDGTTVKYFDHAGMSSVTADARCRNSGTVGNVGANSLTVLPVVPSGVNDVRNINPTGNDDFFLTSLDKLTVGRDEESDEQLRERVKKSEGTVGDATTAAILAALSDLEGVQSVTLFENKTNTDNTGSGGLPPKSFEAVVFGTETDQSIAETIFETKGLTSHDYGGANGTAQSATVTADNGQTFTIEWSEPTEVQIDLTIDIVVDDTYVGDSQLRDDIIDYVGGLDSDGNSIVGTGVGEDVRLDEVRDRIVGADNGVRGISSLSTTPTSSTDSNGLSVVSVASNEVGVTNGTDGSITLNITTV